MIGFLSSLVAVMSGEHALQISDATINTQIADMHEKFAEATRNIFAVLVLIYVSMYAKYPRIQKIGNFFRTYFFITIIGAVAGLVAVSITGALGGALVYGVEAKDPFIRFVVELLGLN